MVDSAPRLELHTSDYPDLDPTPYVNGNHPDAQNVKNNVLGGVRSAVDTVMHHPATQNLTHTAQNITNTVADGPVAQSVKNQTAKASSEFQDLANAKTIPVQPAATGQPLTQYHSMFYRLLSWKNPRATAISYVSVVAIIFAARYLSFLGYTLKALYLVLGATASIEIAGKAIFGRGLASQMRPRRYYVIPRDSLERFLDDFQQLINFFVIEFQRILFAENLSATIASFFAAFFSYWLIKWLPLWGLSLIGTSVLFIGPLIYTQNKEFIDENLRHASNVINRQATQVKELAAQQTGRASETAKKYAGEYSQKAQGMLGSAKSTISAKTQDAARAADRATHNAAGAANRVTGDAARAADRVVDRATDRARAPETSADYTADYTNSGFPHAPLGDVATEKQRTVQPDLYVS